MVMLLREQDPGWSRIRYVLQGNQPLAEPVELDLENHTVLLRNGQHAVFTRVVDELGQPLHLVDLVYPWGVEQPA